MSLTDLEVRKRERASYFNKLNKLLKIATDIIEQDISDEVSLNEFEARYNDLEALYASFLTAHQSILTMLINEKQDTKDDEIICENFEDSYYSVKSKAINIYHRLRVEVKPVNKPMRVKLPQIELPIFSGDIKQYITFKELFTNLIDNNNEISEIEKYHYLISSLRHEPKKLLQNLPMTAVNYRIALNMLDNRYFNKRLIANKHFETIQTLKPIHNKTALNLRNISDNFMENFKALQALELSAKELNNFLFLNLYLQKLDPETRERFELSLEVNEFPTMEQCNEFIQAQCRALEVSNKSVTSNHKSDNNVNKPGNNFQYGSNKPKNYSFLTNAQDQNCTLCNSKTHFIAQCSSFLNKSISDRFNFIKNSQLCFNCLKNHKGTCLSKASCKTCGKKHSTLLHFESKANSQTNVNSPIQDSQPSTSKTVLTSIATNSTVLLPTVLFNILDSSGTNQKVRAILDSGSQINLISEACIQRLGLPRTHNSIPITGIKGSATSARGITSCIVTSDFNKKIKYEIDAIVISSICGHMPSTQFELNDKNYIQNLNLSDPLFNIPQSVDMLLGAELFPKILLGNKIFSNTQSDPVAMNTVFGYILLGKLHFNANPINNPICLFLETSLEETVRKFWELEQVPTFPIEEPENKLCENHYIKNVVRDSTGRYTVSLPFKNDPNCLGDSRNKAMKFFYSLEKSLLKNNNLYTEYKAFMQDYLDAGHMQIAPKESIQNENSYLIPHHCVIRPQSTSTKLRVVFNSSATTTNGLSLNDIMLKGPKLQKDIPILLLHFRVYKYVLIADIKQMYRQIKINPKQWDYQKIFWRFSPSDPLLEYQLMTVTYGTRSAPFLALRTLKQLADDERKKYPLAAKVLDNSVYVDDVVTGADSIDDLLKIQSELIQITSSGGFPLRKWASNTSSALKTVPEEHTLNLDPDQDTILKILGLKWNSKLDYFFYEVQPQSNVGSKRTVLSELARIYDPLGFLSPITFFIKSLIQKLWSQKIDWDDKLPSDVHDIWTAYQTELPLLKNISINRHLPVNQKCCSYELHGFCDSSILGYGSVIYLRTYNKDNNQITCNLLIAKSKVSPLKRISIPRLELCAAMLLADLMKFVLITYEPLISVNKIYAYTDSTIVLNWLSSSPHRWKTFVANRVTIIQEKIPFKYWNHISTHENPSDCLSRGLTPSQLISHPLWWKGPQWLCLPYEQWPKPLKIVSPSSEALVEEVKNVLIVNNSIEFSEIINKFSSLQKLQRVTCLCINFIKKCKNIETSDVVTHKQLNDGLMRWIKIVQNIVFKTEISQIKNNKSCTGPLRALNPFIDNEGILRVGGRLKNAPIEFSAKYPAILPRHHQLTFLIIKSYHITYLHPGFNTLHNILRQQFWILSPHRAIRHVLGKCITCFKTKPVSFQPLMGNLPEARISAIRAFKYVGVDFAGPIKIKMSKTRGKTTLKSYICLFVCFTTKALHLELASELSTQAFLAAFQRFTARRGKCSHIYSDQGTNFIGARNELYQCMSRAVAIDNFEWHFNPPSAPHMGGLWEAGVKATKTHLVRVIGDQILTYEELTTVLTQVESVLNSRPLCSLSSDPNDLQALTPGHFLTLEPLGTLPEDDLSHLNVNRLSRWQKLKYINQSFWRRWRHEYLHTLQQRHKWSKPETNIQIGQLVIIKDDRTKSHLWSLGRIVAVHEGTDNIIRVATVKTQSGTLQRPVHKLCPLPSQ